MTERELRMAELIDELEAKIEELERQLKAIKDASSWPPLAPYPQYMMDD